MFLPSDVLGLVKQLHSLDERGCGLCPVGQSTNHLPELDHRLELGIGNCGMTAALVREFFPLPLGPLIGTALALLLLEIFFLPCIPIGVGDIPGVMLSCRSSVRTPYCAHLRIEQNACRIATKK